MQIELTGSAMVETPIPWLLTLPTGGSKTDGTRVGVHVIPPAPQHRRLNASPPAKRRRFDPGDGGRGAVLRTGQGIGAKAPAAGGDIDAT